MPSTNSDESRVSSVDQIAYSFLLLFLGFFIIDFGRWITGGFPGPVSKTATFGIAFFVVSYSLFVVWFQDEIQEYLRESDWFLDDDENEPDE